MFNINSKYYILKGIKCIPIYIFYKIEYSTGLSTKDNALETTVWNSKYYILKGIQCIPIYIFMLGPVFSQLGDSLFGQHFSHQGPTQGPEYIGR